MGDFADDACNREIDQWLGCMDEMFNDPDYEPNTQYICRRKPKGPGPCPLCGEETKPVTGKYGLFYGCINYPACTGKRNY
jgi:DNA topoisomerase-3